MVGIPDRGKYLEICGIIISDYREFYLTNVDGLPIAYS